MPPPPRTVRNVQVSYSAMAQKNIGVKTATTASSNPATATTASTTPVTTTSTTSSISNTQENESGIQQLKRKLDEIDQERIKFKSQQQKVEDNISTLTQSMTKMGGDILDVIKDVAKLNDQLTVITSLLQQTIRQKGGNEEPRIKSPPRKRRDNKDAKSVSSWASEGESGDETQKVQGSKGEWGIEDMMVESGILGNM